MKILVVDDSLTIRKIVRRILEMMGSVQVIEAKNGEEGLLLATTEPLDLVITDWNMPLMDGIDMVRRLRAEGFRDLPVVMLSSAGTPREMAQAAEAGVHSFVTKPMTAETIADAVRSAVAERRHAQGA